MANRMSFNLTDVRDGNEEVLIAEIKSERERQQQQWGVQTHSIAEWLMILGEEYGEACQAGNECYFQKDSLFHHNPLFFHNLHKELVQTMAVALAILEGLEHSKPREALQKGDE